MKIEYDQENKKFFYRNKIDEIKSITLGSVKKLIKTYGINVISDEALYNIYASIKKQRFNLKKNLKKI